MEDASQLLDMETTNRDFFQQFTGVREESFYTLEGQQIIRLIMLTEVVGENLQSCWIGYFLDHLHNGKGIMNAVVKMVVDYAFEELHVHRLEAGMKPHNVRSIRVLEKAGFEREGLASKNVKINSVWQDHVTLGIVNPRNCIKIPLLK